MTVQPLNVHVTALVVGSAGLLVTGRSGAGKSTLALALVEHARARGRFASIVSDDRTWLGLAHGRVLAAAPAPIAGLIEVRGFGPAPVAHEARAVIDGVIALVEPDAAPRHRNDATETLLGVDLPKLELAARDAFAATRAVAAWLAVTLQRGYGGETPTEGPDMRQFGMFRRK